jgi:calcium-dependent protein kinase
MGCGSSTATAADGVPATNSENPFACKPRNSSKSDYRIINLLGEGNFGHVYEALYIPTNQKFALKQLHKTTADGRPVPNPKKAWDHEIEVLQASQGPNILKLFDYFEDAEGYYVVTEFYSGGDLFDAIVGELEAVPFFSEKKAAHWSRMLIEPIAYLHANNIVHRDIKPENYVVESKGDDQIVLIDFGMSEVAQDNQIIIGNVQSRGYYSPETITISGDRNGINGKSWKASDMWSIGVVIYLLVEGQLPFNQPYDPSDPRDTLLEQAIQNGDFTLSEGLSPELVSLIRGLLNTDTDARLTAVQALAHPWFETASPEKRLDAKVLTGLVEFAKLENNHFQRAVGSALIRQLTTEERREITATFKKFDKDGGASLDISEMDGLLSELAIPEGAERKKVIAFLDADGSGQVSIDEFVEAVMMFRLSAATEDELKSHFDAADANKNGKISLSEMSQLLGSHLNQNKVAELFALADTDNDGDVSFEEWVAAIKTVPTTDAVVDAGSA